MTDSVIEHHLRGDPAGGRDFHVGLYPMLLEHRCKLLACDFDDGEWRADAGAFVTASLEMGVPALAEFSRSGEGAHVWIFLEESLPAATARSMGAALLRRAMSGRASMSMSSYDRFFPSRDTLPSRSPGRFRLGNLIALPLQRDCRRRGTSVFADPVTWAPFEDQFAALSATAPVSAERVLELAGSSGRRMQAREKCCRVDRAARRSRPKPRSSEAAGSRSPGAR